MSLTVVITPLTVTVATSVLEDDQLKFPLPPVACHKYPKKRLLISRRLTPLRVAKSKYQKYILIKMMCRFQYFCLNNKGKAVQLQTLQVYSKEPYRYGVLISSDLGLPWESENARGKNYRVIDLYILLIVNRVGKWMDLSSLKKDRSHRKWSSSL